MIPTFNRATMLAEAVESALAQDYPALEVVISDNASTDSTQSVVQKYLADSRVKYVRRTVPVPADENWRGLVYEYASGEYGQLLADDDLLSDPSYLSRVVDLLRELNVDAVFSGYIYLDIHTGRERVRNVKMPRKVTPAMWLEVLGRTRAGSEAFPCMAAVYRLAKARCLRAYDPGVPGLDFELALRFMVSGPTGYLDGAFCTARSHESNSSRAVDTVEQMCEGLKIFDRFCAQGAQYGLPRRKLKGASRRLRSIYTKAFTVRAWVRDNGRSPGAVIGLYRRLWSVDPFLASRVFLDPRTWKGIVAS